MADNAEEYIIEGASVGEADIFKYDSEKEDPFYADAKTIKSLEGVGRGFKQKTTRLEKKFEGADGAKSKKQEEHEYVNGYTLFDVVVPPYNMDYLGEIYESTSAAHHSAVNAKAANIVGLGYDFELSNGAKRSLEKVKDDTKLQRKRRYIAKARDTYVDWLESCNKEDDFLETLRKVWVDYETTGNGYIEVGRTLNGVIKYIGHVSSSTMRVRRKRDGYVQIVENRAVFFRNMGDLKTSNPIGNDNRPNEIIHLKKYSPTNGYYGIPDIVSAMNAVAGDEFASRYNLDYFENKAVPRYLIVVHGAKLGENSEKRLHDFFKTGLKGQNHRSLYIPLPASSSEHKVDFKIEPVEANIQDSSFEKYRKANLNEILMAHRVPITKIGAAAEGVALAVARDADKNFKEQVCQPEQRMLHNKLHKIIKEITDMFVLKLEEMALSDEDTMSKIDERYLRMKVLVPNEVRARKKLPGIEGGDQPVDLKSQQAADQNARANQSRSRDRERSANAPDNDGEGRATQGDGRSSE